MEKPGKYMSGPPRLRDLFGNLTEYMPKIEAVKQVARITEQRCFVLQFTPRHAGYRFDTSPRAALQEEP